MSSRSASPYITRLAIFACIIFASTTVAETPEWLQSITPKKGDTLQSEIQCYALPYGTIGFVSHLLTYYTIIMITLGRSPLPPWRELKAPMFDIFLGAASLIIGLVLTIFTMIRCHQRWEFLLIAFWKATLSITLGILSVHAAVVLKRNGFPDGGEIVWWIAIYAVGTTIGLTGLASLIFKSWGNRVVVLTCKVFGGVAVVAIVFGWGFAAGRRKYDGRLKLAAFLTLGIVGVLAALYSDWVLAGLSGNLIGMPSSDNSLLYFGYFAAKRLPFFSV